MTWKNIVKKDKEFKPHMMFDPKTGKGFKANKMEDHLRMKEMGYLHEHEMKDRKQKSNEGQTMTWFDIVKRKKHPALKRAGVSGFGKPKRTPKHPKKSHVVVVKDGDKVKTIRFGEQGASVAGKPKKGESKRMKAKRKSFKSRHRKNIKRGRTSAAYWANKVKW